MEERICGTDGFIDWSECTHKPKAMFIYMFTYLETVKCAM